MKKEYLPNRIFTISNILSGEDCQKYISLSEEQGYEDAPIITAQGSELDKNVRNNERLIINSKEVAEKIWQLLYPFIPTELEGWSAIGLNERIRFYRYDINQYFAPHYDGSYRRSSSEESKLTLIIYLNDDFEGGETSFDLRFIRNPLGEISIKPEKAMALCFDHFLIHQGNSVMAGRKYVLRTDVMYKKQ